MGMHSSIIRMLQQRQARARLRRAGALGDFYRAGGNALLEDLPVATDDVVVDAGGFEGDWTAAMLVRYGCRSEVFEPVPGFAAKCRTRFGRNSRVNVHEAALGGCDRTARFAIDSVASSEHRSGDSAAVDARVEDVCRVLDRLGERHRDVACLKLNIEGGEYEVLERIVDASASARCRSILVQFHPQPTGWEARLSRIVRELSASHALAWRHPMVWELWIRR